MPSFFSQRIVLSYSKDNLLCVTKIENKIFQSNLIYHYVINDYDKSVRNRLHCSENENDIASRRVLTRFNLMFTLRSNKE